MNCSIISILSLIAFLTFPIGNCLISQDSLVVSSPTDSAGIEVQAEELLSLEDLKKLPVHRARVIDPVSGAKYWLPYRTIDDLMQIRSLGYKIIKTRPPKKSFRDSFGKLILDELIQQVFDILKESIKKSTD